MKVISEEYKIYLTDDKTLLFYGTLKNQELDKPKIVINDSTGAFTMLAEEMANYYHEMAAEKWRNSRNSTGNVVHCIV